MRWLILISISALAGCHPGQPVDSSKTSNDSSTLTSSSTSTEPKSIETILVLPGDFKPTYRVADTRDVGFGNMKRYVVSITLPAGLKKEEVERNFKHAVLQVYKDKKPDAVMIWGYQIGDDIKQPFTVGDAIFALNGQWVNASESDGSLQNYQIVIKVKDSYLNTKNDMSVDDEITLTALKSDVLKDQDATSVRIWNDPGNRADSNILLKVPNGTKAKILEKKQTGAGDYIATVYKVAVKQKTGWVDFFDILEYQNSEQKE